MKQFFCILTCFLLITEIYCAPLSLEVCKKIALDTNPLSKAATEGIQIANETVGIAQSAYYPRVDFHAHYERWQTYNFFRLNNPFGNILPVDLNIVPNIIGPTNDYNFAVNSRYTLYDWGKRRAILMESISEKNAAIEESQRVYQEILLNVSIAFYDLLANRALEKVAIKNLERSEKNHQFTKERESSGSNPLSDVYQAEVLVSEARQEVVRVQNLVRISKVNLNSAMGLPPDVEIEISDELLGPPSLNSFNLKEAQYKSIVHRPEIKSALAHLKALKFHIKSIEGDFGPQVTAVGAYGKRDANWPPKFDEWKFGVRMEMPLFTGYELTHKLRKSQAEYCRAKAEYESLSLNIQQQVWIAYSKMEEGAEMIRTSKAQVKNAEESMRLTEERYQVGAGVITDLLSAQTALNRAYASHVDALWRYQSAIIYFIWAQGLLY